MSNTHDKQKLSPQQKSELLHTLRARFEQHMNRHKSLEWLHVESRLEANASKLYALFQMENTGGEPDVVGRDDKTGGYLFYDCAAESPKGRRSLCYDDDALDARKEHKPEGSAAGIAAAMGVELLTEADYRRLQSLGKFDIKTSSWIATPAEIRALGGALFADYRYGQVFVYHNGALSYYAARGFRGSLTV